MHCIEHAEQIHIQFPKIDKLVVNVKRVFQKAPYRVLKFHTDAPNMVLVQMRTSRLRTR